MSPEKLSPIPEIPSETTLSELALAYTYVVTRKAGHEPTYDPTKQENTRADYLSREIPEKMLIHTLGSEINPDADPDELCASALIFQGLRDNLQKDPRIDPEAIHNDLLILLEFSTQSTISLYRHTLGHYYSPKTKSNNRG